MVKLLDVVHNAADSIIGRRRGTRKEQWISNESWTLIDERKKVKLKQDQTVSGNLTATFGRKYYDLHKAVKNSCKRDKKQWIESKCQEAEPAACRTSIPIKSKAGAILLSEEEQNVGWVENLNKVLNQPIPTILLDLDDDINNVSDDGDISMNDISREDIEERLRAPAKNKAAGLDFIPAELLSWGGAAMVDELTKLQTWFSKL